MKSSLIFYYSASNNRQDIDIEKRHRQETTLIFIGVHKMNLINTYHRARTVAFMTEITLTDKQKEDVIYHSASVDGFISHVAGSSERVPLDELKNLAGIYLNHKHVKLEEDHFKNLSYILAENAKQKRLETISGSAINPDRLFRYIRIPHIGMYLYTIKHSILMNTPYGDIEMIDIPIELNQSLNFKPFGIDVPFFDIGYYQDPQIEDGSGIHFFIIVHIEFMNEVRLRRGRGVGVIAYPHPRLRDAFLFHRYDRMTGDSKDDVICHYDETVKELISRYSALAEGLGLESPEYLTIRRIVYRLGTRSVSSTNLFRLLVLAIQLKYRLAYCLKSSMYMLNTAGVILARPFITRYDPLMVSVLYHYDEEEHAIWVQAGSLLSDIINVRRTGVTLGEITAGNLITMEVVDINVLYEQGQIDEYTHKRLVERMTRERD